MIELEKFSIQDINDLLDWVKYENKEFLIQFAGPNYKYPLDKTQIIENLNDNSYILFKAVEKKTDLSIGHCQLMKIDHYNKEATIGRVLLKKGKRGLGYGIEMIDKLVLFSSQKMKLKKLNLKVFEFNGIAYDCYMKIGFKPIKIDNVYCCPPGEVSATCLR